MGQFEVRARLKIREGQLEGFKCRAAEIMRQAREKDTGTVAYDWRRVTEAATRSVFAAGFAPSAQPTPQAGVDAPVVGIHPGTGRA